jgi:hypothetical protein
MIGSLSPWERARVRGDIYIKPKNHPHPAFGHLLPEGEGTQIPIEL